MTWAVRAFIVVDFPAPLGPSRPTHVPCGTSRSRPSTAVMPPKRLTAPRRLMAEFTMLTLGRPGDAELIGATLSAGAIAACASDHAPGAGPAAASNPVGALRPPAQVDDGREPAAAAPDLRA